MPGTIQVTVLEFKGVSSSSKPSAKSLKVSMGKRQFQTWDKGDFSFPITKLGEDLVVCLLDAGGNEIAHQDIRTMQIIEKGNWDEVFDINGGGNVHMKLRFVLSEEERKRIRLVRESAVKKKLETNPNIKLRLLQVPDSVETSTKYEQKISDSPKRTSDTDEMSPKVEEVSQVGSSLASATSSVNPSETALVPDATEGSSGKHELVSESPRLLAIVPYEPLDNVRPNADKGPPSPDNKKTVASKLLNDHPSVDKTPSNVRKMISAFESSQIQEVKSLKKVSSVPAQLNRFRKDYVLSENQESKAESLADFKDHTAETVDDRDGIVPSDPSHAPKELSSTETPIPSGGNDHQKLEISAVDLMRQSTSETATSSGRMAEEQTQCSELSTNSISSTESSLVQGRGRGTSLESSTVAVGSNKKPTLEYYNEECYSGQSSGMWIFPDNTRRLCITTAGKEVAKIGHHQNEAKTYKGKKISSESKNAMHETEFKTEKKQKTIVYKAEAGSGSSPNGSSNGLVGQVIKIAVIIGFGVLVLLTRQKEPRKKHREENGNLFHVPKYV